MPRAATMIVAFVLALAACATPASKSPTAAPDSSGAGEPQGLCQFAPPAPSAPGLLPAPVYFLGSDAQVWRLEMDGSTATAITHEPAPVTYLDVSPVTGALAYISGNALICADALGGNRTALALGPDLANMPGSGRISTEMNRARWSPDGKRIAYGLNGVVVFDLASGASSTLIANDPIPTDFSTPISGPLYLYSPGEWSPDGSRLLVNVSYYPEGGGLAVLNLADQSLTQLTSPDGMVCCYAAWSSDSRSVYFANDSIGMVASGLWRADAATGQGETLIAGEAGGTFSLVAHPHSLADGRLEHFLATIPSFPDAFVPMTMTRSDADGVSNRAALRTDTALPYEALWAPDGSGALIVDRVGQIVTEQEPYLIYGPLAWLRADGSPPITLPVAGFSLRWGK